MRSLTVRIFLRCSKDNSFEPFPYKIFVKSLKVIQKMKVFTKDFLDVSFFGRYSIKFGFISSKKFNIIFSKDFSFSFLSEWSNCQQIKKCYGTKIRLRIHHTKTEKKETLPWFHEERFFSWFLILREIFAKVLIKIWPLKYASYIT